MEQAGRNDAQVNSDFRPVIGSEQTVVEEEESQLGEKQSERIDKYTRSDNSHLCRRTWWSEVHLPLIPSSLPFVHWP